MAGFDYPPQLPPSSSTPSSATSTLRPHLSTKQSISGRSHSEQSLPPHAHSHALPHAHQVPAQPPPPPSLPYQGLPRTDSFGEPRGPIKSPANHSRDHSAAVGQSSGQGTTATQKPAVVAPHSGSQAVRDPLARPSITAVNAPRPPPPPDDGLERKPSYGHHRQTSIVHGQAHSRNPSFASSPAASPPGSDIIEEAGRISEDLPDLNMSTASSPTAAPPGANGDVSPFGTTTTTPTGNAYADYRTRLRPGQGLNDGHMSDSGASPHPSKRADRLTGGKPLRDHSHSRSQSKHPRNELKTVGEYALHHLLNAFFGMADHKIEICSAQPNTPEPHVEDICGPGVDPAFDQLISALGHVARQKPKPLIDTIMIWRRTKSENANAVRSESNQSNQSRINPRNISMPRRNTEPLHLISDQPYAGSAMNGAAAVNGTGPRQDSLIQAERQSTVSVYLISRVLIEVVRQTTLQDLGMDTDERLEDVYFGQLKMVDPDHLVVSPLKMANQAIFSELLGWMSELNFVNVADRFLKDIERAQRDGEVKGGLSKEGESRMQLIILGMRHLRIKTETREAWSHSCDFLLKLARLFANAHGAKIKHAYCQIFEKLLLPIAATPGVDLDSPQWKAVLDVLGPRVAQMTAKPRHWPEAAPVHALIPCVSTTGVFASHWIQTLNGLQPKLKDRLTRSIALRAIARLLWTYLYHHMDAPATSLKRLEEVVKMVLPAGRKSYLSTDPTVSEPIIEIMRIIGFRHQDLCFKSMIFPTINSEYFTTGKDLRVEQLEPEKIVIGIRAFLAIMSDLEKGAIGRPPFPDFLPERNSLSQSSLPPATKLMSRAKGMRKREERLSQPVLTSSLNEVARDYYARFCAILGKITMICDDAFGGQAVLDEKFSTTPKTPIAETFSFSRKDDHQIVMEQKQGFYDLFHVAVQALPRCLSAAIPFNPLVNLLCTGTAHVQSQIAHSSAQSLKSIARQSYAQQVTVGFARFIFNFDDRYSTMSDGGMLGPGHIENTLKLYVELLQIWIEEIKRKTKEASPDSLDHGSSAKRAKELDLSSVWAYVDEIESHGLFFLCSQSRRVRSFAVTVLRLITEFDIALGAKNKRVIHVMEDDALAVMDFNDEQLSVAERSRLQRGIRKGSSRNTLIELCSSDISYDSTLWFKVFPNLIRISYKLCPFATTLGREIVSARLLQMHKLVAQMSETQRGLQNLSYDPGSARMPSRGTTNPPEVIIEQWKLYLIFTCTTLNNTDTKQHYAIQSAQHARKVSKPARQNAEKISSATALFEYVIDLLSVSQSSIREAVVVALGSINVNLYKILLESLSTAVNRCNDEARQRIHQRTVSSPRRNPRMDRLRTEVTHVYKLTSHFLRDDSIYTDDWILSNIVAYTNDLKIFLSDAEVQNDWDFQKLRRHYCGLLEELFEGINRTKDPARWMPFEARKSAFHLMEDWCGYSPNSSNQGREREDTVRQTLSDHQRDYSDRRVVTAAMEIEKRNLKTAALSAMAALCGGPVAFTTERKANLQFDVRRMLSWVDGIFGTPSDRMHAIGRRALSNLITHNVEHPYLLERSLQMCYQTSNPKALESYFDVVSQVLQKNENYPLPFWKILSAILFILGNEKSDLRSKSLQLLKLMEDRRQKSSKIQDFDISVSDKTTAVYKLAQFEISRRLANQHPEMAFLIFSELTKYFKELEPKDQRNIVATLLPWIQTVELQLDPNGGSTPNSYMLLANLFEITINSSQTLHNEVQALWQALATGPHAGNVQFVLDFVISLCLEKREQNFVDYAKQIVVFLSSTQAGLKVVEFLIMHINPKEVVQEKQKPLVPPPETLSLPYCVDLSLALPVGNKQSGFSMGHLCLILLVDLMVSPVQLTIESVTLLLQTVFVLWDHYIPLVQDQAREMLVHLIHELVVSKIDGDQSVPNKQSIEELAEAIRRNDAKVVWAYDDGIMHEEDTSQRVLKPMEHLCGEVINAFSLTYPGIKESWSKTTLHWATSCTVRHLACRSFQMYRCILSSLDESMLADMLARLSNTIAADEVDVQTFSMEILTTLKTVIAALSPAELLKYPQLFWATCACLNTIHESEFIESLAMLELFVGKIDINDEAIIQLYSENVPARWEGTFEGVQPLLYRGLRSDVAINKTLSMLGQLSSVRHNPLIGHDDRIIFAILANLPRYLQSMDEETQDHDLLAAADSISQSAEILGYVSIARVLKAFADLQFRSSNDFLIQSGLAIQESFFPRWDFEILVFLMGLLTNRLPWFKTRTMQLLCVLIPDIDMRKPEIASHGPDLISPLLRLLQTEFCPQALEVLDHVMAMPSTPMDKHHLRMSMVESHSRNMRKEYDRTRSLFGIPEESGWSIPMPAIHAASTRSNVHSVFYTCANPESLRAGTAATPDLEFHRDEFSYGFPPTERTATMTSEDAPGEGNMGELVMKLDSLDDFFDDDGDGPSPGLEYGLRGSAPYDKSFSEDSSDAGVRYDQQTLPLLKQGLGRTPSVSSFQAGYTESRAPSTSREKTVEKPAMSPSAFLPRQRSLSRPGLHSRSVTSPSATHVDAGQSVPDMMSDNDMNDVFSEDDARGVSSHSSRSGSLSLGKVMRPVTQSTRAGVRRLTGSSRDRDKARDGSHSGGKSTTHSSPSPKVPKVPDIYLQNAAPPNI